MSGLRRSELRDRLHRPELRDALRQERDREIDSAFYRGLLVAAIVAAVWFYLVPPLTVTTMVVP
jgi:hypothetical protein